MKPISRQATRARALPVAAVTLSGADWAIAMTPVQRATLPLALAGKNRGQNRQRKTAAFAIPLLAKLDVSRLDVSGAGALPTRELAEQVTQELRRLARARRTTSGS